MMRSHGPRVGVPQAGGPSLGLGPLLGAGLSPVVGVTLCLSLVRAFIVFAGMSSD